ncbi:MAG: hypothetical protein AAFY41_09280 [Bacteroidota bacterium]
MKYLLATAVFIIYSSGYAQMSEDDKVTYQAAVDWLDTKLNYVYYDDVSGKWWNNTFYINDEKEVTVKHISSEKPNTANIRSKNYSIRTFKLTDINPYTIKITNEEDSKGRIVKGKTLEIRTFGNVKSIHKKINNRRGSSTSFLFFSFPEFLNDSLANYASIVKSKLYEAIIASTQVYSSSLEENVKTVLKTLNGTFKGEDGSEWKTEQIFPNTLKISNTTNNRSFFGFDSIEGLFYYTNISEKGITTIRYQLVESEKINLKEIGGSSEILIETLNSFNKNGINYFRQ